MKRLTQLTLCFVVVAGAALTATAVHHELTPNLVVVQAASLQEPAPPYQNPPDQGPDPAAVNQAPAPSGPSYTTEAPPPDQNPEDYNNAEQPTATAPQPPPPLPDYDQPPPPADGYIWTPGYWAWGASGYYWVPGAWTEPPYAGALWTPGYWGFYGGRYMFYPGHWGLHIGFYGGINYGFGYLGFGYEGGYWNAGRFFYNRAYNHIDARVVHNVYNYHANVRVNNLTRQSYRGGPNGVQAHPRPSEGAAWHEPYAPRMSTQVQHERDYGAVHEQYANQNHGKPPSGAVSRPVPADRNVRPQAHASHGGEQRH